MSKRALKTYTDQLDKDALREQIHDLYERFPEVKTYYDFIFNPKEDKLLSEAMGRIAEEYFPKRRRRARARRSVAHKYLKHFKKLGVDPSLQADLMAFNLETGLRYEKVKKCPEAFYKSMYRSFREWGAHLVHHRIYGEYAGQYSEIALAVERANWPNKELFLDFVEQLDPS
ncbi:DUF6155 family protein [Robiginitalea aurantiaca]|uniref:DUF6155 family protein n=1 Tax=Robiginitalea aurantiaca TaxID=3056915 RepID=A0ABT7WFW8_9FLAO|nr:DUF6155 family protein [Robiginitalea aurantiaca]MDM9631763.1 DUF6155 family protein [Robiginitalea aurantiaca]